MANSLLSVLPHLASRPANEITVDDVINGAEAPLVVPTQIVDVPTSSPSHK